MQTKLSEVSKRYGTICALEGLDLEIRPGEVVALLGPNGAGKTTTVNLLLGLIHPDTGKVQVLGGKPRASEIRQRVGAMLQIGKVPETLTVGEHLELFASYYPRPLPLTEVVNCAGLEGLMKRRFGRLSSGQQRRLLFALAICGNPDLLFLDEPTVGLDVESRRRLWQQIRRLAGQDRSVLLTTHYLDEADALADHIVVLHQGHVIARGRPDEIKRLSSGRRVSATTQLTLEQLNGLPDLRSLNIEGDRVEIQTGRGEALVRELLRLDPQLRNLEVSAPSLEDAFLTLVAADRDQSAIGERSEQ